MDPKEFAVTLTIAMVVRTHDRAATEASVLEDIEQSLTWGRIDGGYGATATLPDNLTFDTLEEPTVEVEATD
jgi:hypothetical protein